MKLARPISRFSRNVFRMVCQSKRLRLWAEEFADGVTERLEGAARRQPKPEDYGYDLDRALSAVVGVRATVPGDAFTAETLGTERAGNGVVIRDDGLVLTIGYLITEAETVWLTPTTAARCRAMRSAYDQETGFGLVQALARLDLPALPLGHSRDGAVGDRRGRRRRRRPRRMRSRRASSPSRSSPATGNTCSTRRSSPRPRIRTGAAPR